MVRRALFAGLLLGPFTIVLHYTVGPDETVEFLLAAVSLIPLAWLIGEATEHAAERTGPGIGGFMNATFGNAPELIIALIAVNEGLTEVVRGSLTGSVVGNLLLVLGFSLAMGPRDALDRWSSFLSFGVIAIAILLFLIPSVPSWEGDPDRNLIVDLSVPVSIALLVVYGVVTIYSLRRHRELHVSSDEEIEAWTLKTSLLVLGAATVVTALVAEILVGSLETFAERFGLTDFFVAAVIVAIVGNAAEHGGAVVVARRGKVKLAAEIALASAAQVAVFLIPAVALLSWLIDPLALGFREVEIAALAGGLAVTVITLWSGQASKARGAVLLVAYAAVAVAFYAAGDRTDQPGGLVRERARRPRERVRRDVELRRRSRVVTGDAEQLAQLAALDDAPAIVGLGREPRNAPSDGAVHELEPEAAATPGEDELRPLRPPPSEHRRDVVRCAVVGTPEAREARELFEGCLREIECKRLRPGAGTRVEEHHRTRALGPVDAHGGEEARHGAAVADEDPVAAAVELEPEPPAQRPFRLVGHRLDARHLVERLRRRARRPGPSRGNRPSTRDRRRSTRASPSPRSALRREAPPRP